MVEAHQIDLVEIGIKVEIQKTEGINQTSKIFPPYHPGELTPQEKRSREAHWLAAMLAHELKRFWDNSSGGESDEWRKK